MNRTHGLLVAALVLSAALGAAAAQAQPAIVNGHFDLLVPVTGTGGNWTAESNSGGWLDGSGNPAPCYYLNDFGQAGSDPSLRQQVDGFVPGNDYTLLGDYRLEWAGGTPDSSFEVRVDGDVVLSVGPAGSGFQPFSVTFTATAASHVIWIAAETNGSDHSYCVDNIRFEGQVPGDAAAWGRVKALYR